MPKINKAKNLSAGVSKTTKKAPMVDPKGAYTKVQQRTLGNMKKGGKIKKAQTGRTISETIPYTNELGRKASFTSGMRNAKIKSYSDDKNYVTKAKTDASGNVTKMKARRTVKGFLTGAPKLTDNLKKGGVIKAKKK